MKEKYVVEENEEEGEGEMWMAPSLCQLMNLSLPFTSADAESKSVIDGMMRLAMCYGRCGNLSILG